MTKDNKKDWSGNKATTFAVLGASNHCDHDREKNDYYATDPIAIDRLQKVFDIPHNLYECSCGEGHLSKRLKELGCNVFSTDLIDRGYGDKVGVDFLKVKAIPKGYSILTNPPYKCFDIDTEIKTRKGWKKYNDINGDDEVLSVNIDTQQLEWSKINNLIIKDVDEDMLHFNHRFLDIKVTQEHRMFTYSSSSNKPQFKNNDVYLAKDINSCSYIPKVGYKWYGANNNSFKLDGCYVSNGQKDIWHDDINIDMKTWAKFLGLWIADGSYRKTKNSKGNNRFTISIKQHQNGYDVVRDILDKLPFNYKIYHNKNQNTYNFDINSKQLWLYLSTIGDSRTKYIPEYIKDNSIDIINAFMDGYVFGDSHITKLEKSEVTLLSSVSKRLIEDLQEIVLKLGYMTNYVELSIASGKLYQISWNKTKERDLKLFYQKPKIEHYKGKVFCLNIEKNHFFVLRRNNKIFVSGNCAKEFVQHSLELLEDGGQAIFFLKIQFLETQGRYDDLFENKQLKYVYVATSRVACGMNGAFTDDKGKKISSAACYCWYVFEKGYQGEPIIRWF